MSIQNALASVAVKNLSQSISWYEKLLGSNASQPMPDVAEWVFDGGGGLQVYLLPERAGSGSFTLAVSDFEKEVIRLQTLGINTAQQAANDRVKTVMITDPDGNHIALAEAIDQSLAH